MIQLNSKINVQLSFQSCSAIDYLCLLFEILGSYECVAIWWQFFVQFTYSRYVLFDTCSESFIQRGDHGIEPVDVCSHSDEMSNSQFRYQKAQQVEI